MKPQSYELLGMKKVLKQTEVVQVEASFSSWTGDEKGRSPDNETEHARNFSER